MKVYKKFLLLTVISASLIQSSSQAMVSSKQEDIPIVSRDINEKCKNYLELTNSIRNFNEAKEVECIEPSLKHETRDSNPQDKVNHTSTNSVYPDKIDIESKLSKFNSDFIEEELLRFLNVAIKDHPKYVESVFYEELLNLYSDIKKSKIECDIGSIYDILLYAKNHRLPEEGWLYLNLEHSKMNSKGAKILKLDNEIIVDLHGSRKKLIGKGASKLVNDGFFSISIKPTITAKSLVVITAMDSSKENKDSLDDIEYENMIYSLLAKKKKELNLNELIGLAEAKLITLSNKKLALIQERYDSNLEESGLLQTDPVNAFIQIGDGLSFLHNMNGIHGDLKPANVLVRGKKVVLADFGLTHFPKKYRFTRTTPDYEAPEMAGKEFRTKKGNKEYKIQKYKSRDIYSLGMMMFMSNPISKSRKLSTPSKRCWNEIEEMVVAKKLGNFDIVNSSEYGDCVRKKANEFHDLVQEAAKQQCSGKDCLLQIASDCLNPDFKKRPPVDEVLARLRAL